MVKVSIIVPVYNAEKYLERCIRAVINQTLKEIELILVDDGSVDKSLEICNTYAHEDTRIKIIHKNNEGAGIARNIGIEMAEGEFVAFLDSDDYVDKNMYEELYNEAFSKEVDASFCGSNKVINGNIIKSGKIGNIIYNRKDILEKSIPYICSGGKGIEIKGAVSVWRGIYNTNFIRDNKILFKNEREFLSEDTLFNLDFFSKATKIVFIDKHLHYQCIIKESLSRGSVIFSLEAIHNFYGYILNNIMENENVNKEKCIAILRKRCLEEYRAKIAREIKKEEDRNKINRSLEELRNDTILQEVIENKQSMKKILELKDKLFMALIKYRCYNILKLIFRTSKLVKE